MARESDWSENPSSGEPARGYGEKLPRGSQPQFFGQAQRLRQPVACLLRGRGPVRRPAQPLYRQVQPAVVEDGQQRLRAGGPGAVWGRPRSEERRGGEEGGDG